MSKIKRIKEVSDYFDREMLRINEIPYNTYKAKDKSVAEAEKEFDMLGKKRKEEKLVLIKKVTEMLKNSGMDSVELSEVIGHQGPEWRLDFKLKHSVQSQGNPIVALVQPFSGGK